MVDNLFSSEYCKKVENSQLFFSHLFQRGFSNCAYAFLKSGRIFCLRGNFNWMENDLKAYKSQDVYKLLTSHLGDKKRVLLSAYSKRCLRWCLDTCSLKLINLKPLTSCSMDYVEFTEQLFRWYKMELTIFFYLPYFIRRV